jgi:hypothetical protein
VYQDIPTPAYDPYENRSTTRQVNGQQTKFFTQLFLTTNYSLFNVNMMNLPFLHLPVKNRVGDPVKHTLVTFPEPLHYTNEGSEFLDDAIRIEDLPALYPEENITDERS